MIIKCPTCGIRNHIDDELAVKGDNFCGECGRPMPIPSPPEKKKAETERGKCIAHCQQGRIRIAQIKMRDANGPTEDLSTPEKFLQLGDKFYDLKFIQSVPAYHAGQLEFCDE